MGCVQQTDVIANRDANKQSSKNHPLETQKAANTYANENDASPTNIDSNIKKNKSTQSLVLGNVYLDTKLIRSINLNYKTHVTALPGTMPLKLLMMIRKQKEQVKLGEIFLDKRPSFLNDILVLRDKYLIEDQQITHLYKSTVKKTRTIIIGYIRVNVSIMSP
eukprot:443643_1